MLEVKNLSASYGAIRALDNVTLDVKAGEIVSLVGANGAGKSTLLNVVSGVVKASSGSIALDGSPVFGQSATKIVRAGIVQVPEGRQVFRNMTVLENLEMGAYTRRDADVGQDMDRVMALFPRLDERRQQLAGLMSGGEQQMLAMGRALLARPRLLLLDEPSMGLAPLVIADIFEMMKRFNQEMGITILLVEQNAQAAMRLSHRTYVLTNGQVTKSGASAELLDDPEVREAFLGKSRSGSNRKAAG